MFNLGKWFKKENPLQQELITWLSGFRSEVFPVGIAAEWLNDVSISQAKLKITLQLPFAAKQSAPEIAAYLNGKSGQECEVECRVSLPKQNQFKDIKHIVLIASGKGGVGKSTTTVNLALALRDEGAKVGILDADIYGPSLPSLLGLLDARPEAADDKTLLPLKKHDIAAQSIGFLVPAEQATVWRGPMASQALQQLLNETAWGELDYLLVDMPPGTGDIQLTMTQKVPASGAVIVTTPQDLALADAQKGIAMFAQVNLPILGLIENMSFFVCNQCGSETAVFGQHGGKRLAMRHGVPLLAEIPLHVGIREQGEAGSDSRHDELAPLYQSAARQLASTLYYQTHTATAVEIVITDD
ncbi:iron-sulfur cluster carrier protein ApbC [Pseudoalteromonas fenneropenaei]|uniref:Iron-sulfur cluster carrier protein n=1 Tax=Pseudoalteromonas fenneropenaei TaxID=1737459 RepID=A0ABV7CF60_9GAMM